LEPGYFLTNAFIVLPEHPEDDFAAEERADWTFHVDARFGFAKAVYLVVCVPDHAPREDGLLRGARSDVQARDVP